jgi:hypothetical protein
LKLSLGKIDQIIDTQKDASKNKGLGFKRSESSRSGKRNLKPSNQQNNPRRNLVRQPNAKKFNGNYFFCNKFGCKAT